MDYQQINFLDLHEQYYERGRPVLAVKMLRNARAGKEQPDLTHLLRHHEEAIDDKETYQRDSFDFLLAYYSLLEIACLIQYVPSTFPDGFREESLWNLSHPAVERYYEKNYPLFLPRLFRLRLGGHSELSISSKKEATHPLFVRFLGMVNHVREDGEIELFQWFLDDGRVAGYFLGDTLELLQSPRDTVNALIEIPGKRTIPQKSISGAQKFLAFCSEFDGLLQEARDFPLFQSAMWTYHSYWFELIGDQVGRRLGRILDSFVKWGGGVSEPNLERMRRLAESDAVDRQSSDRAEKIGKKVGKPKTLIDKDLDPDTEAIRDYVSSSKRVLNRLLSGSYGHELRKKTMIGKAAPVRKPRSYR
ncbi:MAG TPA: hypothetical protein VN937_02210 [Blastocatellia bacterium]|nr:hypothetical protein [Blastocatellia bacterium]